MSRVVQSRAAGGHWIPEGPLPLLPSFRVDRNWEQVLYRDRDELRSLCAWQVLLFVCSLLIISGYTAPAERTFGLTCSW